MLNCHYNLG